MAFGTLAGVPSPNISPNFPSIPGANSAAFNFLTSQQSGIISDGISIDSFVFDYAGEVSIELKADITDHYTEDNTVIQDHIALNPARVVMRGLIGELVKGPAQAGLAGLLGGLQNSLTTINAYIGGKTPQAVVKASKAISQVQKVSDQISSAVSKGKSLLNFLEYGSVSSVKQAKAFQKLEMLFNRRIPFAIQTPYKHYTNMVIETLKAVQSEDTKYVSDITVTLKQIRQASVTLTKTGAAVRLAQKAAQKVQGQGTGKPAVPSTVFNEFTKSPFS